MTELDQHLDSILKASGSGLKNYSMQKTLDDMRNALKAALVAEREVCAKVILDSQLGGIGVDVRAAYLIRTRGEA